MNLIAILICIIIQKIVKIGGWLNNHNSWLTAYLNKIEPITKKFNEWFALAIVITPILLGLAILHLLSLQHLFGLVHLILMIVILLCCLDVREIGSKLTDYFETTEKSKTNKDSTMVEEFIENVLGDKKTKSNPRTITKAIFVHSFESIFAPLFWFLIFGSIFNIYGIALYFLIVNLHKKASSVSLSYAGLAHAAGIVQKILDWVPMRLVALSYTLAGHFMISFAYCYKKIFSLSTNFDDFIVNTGIAALGHNFKDNKEGDSKENQAALSLVNRTLLIWVIGLVLFTLGKMFS